MNRRPRHAAFVRLARAFGGTHAQIVSGAGEASWTAISEACQSTPDGHTMRHPWAHKAPGNTLFEHSAGRSLTRQSPAATSVESTRFLIFLGVRSSLGPKSWGHK